MKLMNVLMISLVVCSNSVNAMLRRSLLSLSKNLISMEAAVFKTQVALEIARQDKLDGGTNSIGMPSITIVPDEQKNFKVRMHGFSCKDIRGNNPYLPLAALHDAIKMGDPAFNIDTKDVIECVRKFDNDASLDTILHYGYPLYEFISQNIENGMVLVKVWTSAPRPGTNDDFCTEVCLKFSGIPEIDARKR